MTAFDAARFRALLAARHPGLGEPLEHVTLTDSTNDDALRAAASGAPDGALFVAEAQRAGRGRRGSTWLSEPGEGLLASLLLRRTLTPETAALLPLAAGAAVRAAVALALAPSAAARSVGVKWPNDVLVDGRKLAGILVESRLRGSGEAAVVVGLGLNVGRLSLPDEVAARSTSLGALGALEIMKETLLHAILTEIAARLSLLARPTGPAALIEEIRQHDALEGKRVRVEGRQGIASGIDIDGSLLIRDEQGDLHSLRAGHVELV